MNHPIWIHLVINLYLISKYLFIQYIVLFEETLNGPILDIMHVLPAK